MQVIKVDFSGKTYRVVQRVSIELEERSNGPQNGAVSTKNGRDCMRKVLADLEELSFSPDLAIASSLAKAISPAIGKIADPY